MPKWRGAELPDPKSKEAVHEVFMLAKDLATSAAIGGDYGKDIYKWVVEVEQYRSIHMLPVEPVPMLIHCPICSARHIDTDEWATKIHHTHACQHCGHTWRPAVVPTVGVQFLPGFKNR